MLRSLGVPNALGLARTWRRVVYWPALIGLAGSLLDCTAGAGPAVRIQPGALADTTGAVFEESDVDRPVPSASKSPTTQLTCNSATSAAQRTSGISSESTAELNLPPSWSCGRRTDPSVSLERARLRSLSFGQPSAAAIPFGNASHSASRSPLTRRRGDFALRRGYSQSGAPMPSTSTWPRSDHAWADSALTGLY